LMALPGGFLDSGEWLDDAFIRELREETKIKVPSPVIRGSVFGTMVADYPHRSMRGRVISRVYGIKLPDGPLPEVKGRSDAKRAVW
ncbi:NUDIX domain-containing protein, partial [Xanthomonas citri pv. citri]|nr:NUDIX domain-containing protein [Xanthomonas citri pv. citri]